jgi:hypothetical protein
VWSHQLWRAKGRVSIAAGTEGDVEVGMVEGTTGLLVAG